MSFLSPSIRICFYFAFNRVDSKRDNRIQRERFYAQIIQKNEVLEPLRYTQPSARGNYGSEGWGFESLLAHNTERDFGFMKSLNPKTSSFCFHFAFNRSQ